MRPLDINGRDEDGSCDSGGDIESGASTNGVSSAEIPRSVSRPKSEVKHRPLLLIGNKIDKLAPGQLNELKAACPQQIFISALTGLDPDPFVKFFSEVYEDTCGNVNVRGGYDIGDLGQRSNRYTTTASAAAHESPILPSFMSSPIR